MHHTRPSIAFHLSYKQDLDLGSVFLLPKKPGRDHFAIVEHEQVSRFQQLRQHIEAQVADRAALPLYMHQSGGIPLR
jgi:hypothetical protein